MIRPVRRLLVASLLLGAVVAGTAGAAGAEIVSEPTTTWGVSGLITGTETESLETPVFAMERIGDVLYVGGRFTDVTDGATTTPRAGLAAFDANTGEWISTFLPELNGAVYALEASTDGTRLFVGGDFDTVGGVATGALVALDPTTGDLDTSWTGRVGGYDLVRALDLEGDDLYVGGGFTSIRSSIGGNAANRLARFDAETGIHDPSFRPIITLGSVWGLDVSPATGRIYVAGAFKVVNGTPVSNGFTSIDLATAALTEGLAPLAVNTTDVNLQYSFAVMAVNGRVYVGGSQHSLQVLDEQTLELERFFLSRNRGDFQHLELVGDVLYAGCHCRPGTLMAESNGVLWWGAPADGEVNAPVTSLTPNSWLNAFDTTTGDRIDSVVVDLTSGGAGIWALQEAPDNCLWVGGAITATAGVPQFGMTRRCGEEPPADTEAPSLPGRPVLDPALGDVTIVWRASTDNVGVVGYRIIDATTKAVLLETTETQASLAGLGDGTYQIAVKAIDAAGNESFRSGATEVTIGDAIVVDRERPAVPGQPQIVAVGADSVDLQWRSTTDNVGVVGYRIIDADTGVVVLDTADAVGTISGLAPGDHRYFTKAYDAAGNVSWRSGITTVTITDPNVVVDTERPSAPGQPKVVTLGGDWVEFSWLAATDNVGVAGYQIIDAATGAVVLDTAATTGTVTTLAPGTYGFYAKAYDAAGNVSWRSGTTSITIENLGS